jgi:carbon-monoxide dehydrogenase medium subunit
MAFEDGEKSVPVDSFFLAPGKTLLGSRGILTAIEIPYPGERTRSLYLKHAVRGAMDIAIVGVAILATRGSNGKHFSDVRIGLGAVAPTPIRAKKAEAIARGGVFAQKQAQDAAKEAAAESRPITDHRGTAEYRRWIVEALTKKGLTAVWEAVTEKGGTS